MIPINLSIDCVILGFDNDQKLKVLLIKKIINKNNDYQYALPGDLLKYDEDLLEGGKRILKSLTSLENIYLKQFHAFGNPKRTKQKKDQSWLRLYRKKPKERVVTIGYIALVNMEEYNPQASSFAFQAEWIDIKDVSNDLAFDHNHIVENGLKFLRHELNHEVMSELLPRKFTLSQLQELHEIVLDQKFDKRNFRKQAKNNGALKVTNEKQKGVSHKPARLYTFKDLS